MGATVRLRGHRETRATTGESGPGRPGGGGVAASLAGERSQSSEEGACGAAGLGVPRQCELGRPCPQAHSPDTFNWPPRNQLILPLRKSQSLTVW